MPSSASETIPWLIEFARELVPKPSRILDVGVGFGKLGYLVREYFEVKDHDRLYRDQWEIDLVGIESFEPYISDLQRSVYSRVVIGDVFDVLPGLGHFDLAFMGDVLEHFEKDRGYALLDSLLSSARVVIIGTPLGFLPHPAPRANPAEEHQSGWHEEDFSRYTVLRSRTIPRIRRDEKVLVVALTR